MKFLCSYVILPTILLLQIGLGQETFKLDKKVSELMWTGYAAAGSYSLSGFITPKDGQIQINKEEIVEAQLTLNMKSIDSENRRLEKNLKSDNFFSVKDFPEAKFVLTTPIPFESGTHPAEGQLTLKGKTHPITTQMTCVKSEDGYRLQGKFIVNRTQFGITHLSLTYFKDAGEYAISDEFDLRYDVNFAK